MDRLLVFTALRRVMAESATNSSSGACSVRVTTSPLWKKGPLVGSPAGRSSTNFSPSREVVRMIALELRGMRTEPWMARVTLALKSGVSLMPAMRPMRTSAVWTDPLFCRSPTSSKVAVSL
jgi:hypothetical protein